MIRIHFIGFQPNQAVNPLAAAMGIGERALDNLASGNRYATLNQTAKAMFESVEIEHADVCVYPHEYFDTPHTADVARRAGAANLPLVFFRQSDSTEPSSPSYGIVYRDSILASKQTSVEEAMPAFCDDPLVHFNNQLNTLEHDEKPEVAFCGYVGAPGMLMGYLMVGRGRKVMGLALRRKAISVLTDSKLVKTKFIERYQYWGGAIKLWERRFKMLKKKLFRAKEDVGGPERDLDVTRRVYQEFLDNLVGSPYNLCIRGAGNFTYRFYETLAAGRIPLFIDTECVLPFSHKINWLNHCVWININEISKMPDRLMQFHKSFDSEKFKHLQLENRKLWEDWLTPQAFYRKVLEEAIEEFREHRQEASATSSV